MWWDVHKGLPEFKGLRISQDAKCASRYPGIKRVTCDRNSDAPMLSKFGVIGWGGNSGFHAVNLAAQFGVSKLILVGYDMRVDMGLHWHGKHAKGLNNPMAKNVERWRKAVDGCAPVLAALGVQTINCSPVSTLVNYPKMTLEDALNA